MRDPRVDPATGDALCSAKSTTLVVVTSADGENVTYVNRMEGRPDAEHRCSLATWRDVAALTDTVSLADKIAVLERERDTSAARLRSLDASLAFLRGAK